MGEREGAPLSYAEVDTPQIQDLQETTHTKSDSDSKSGSDSRSDSDSKRDSD